MTSNRGLRTGVAVVPLVTSLSLTLSAQAWTSRMPAFDLLTYVYSAQELLESGTLPRHGDTVVTAPTSRRVPAWLMLPGAVLFEDPPAFAYVGTGLLHLDTLLGVFLLARRPFGDRTAFLAVVCTVCPGTVFLAGSLWPNGRPDFYVRFMILTCLWAMRRYTGSVPSSS